VSGQVVKRSQNPSFLRSEKSHDRLEMEDHRTRTGTFREETGIIRL
jgi:hypothetical protein